MYKATIKQEGMIFSNTLKAFVTTITYIANLKYKLMYIPSPILHICYKIHTSLCITRQYSTVIKHTRTVYTAQKCNGQPCLIKANYNLVVSVFRL